MYQFAIAIHVSIVSSDQSSKKRFDCNLFLFVIRVCKINSMVALFTRLFVCFFDCLAVCVALCCAVYVRCTIARDYQRFCC